MARHDRFTDTHIWRKPMKKTLLALPLLLAATPLLAQTGSTPNAADPGLDHFVARQTARLMAADKDGDGRISRTEMTSVPAKGHADPNRRFDRIDANQDGYLDSGEIRAAMGKRYARMAAKRNADTNGSAPAPTGGTSPQS
jgi:hypothetical protein